jgi:hypothetical protein
MAPPFGNGPASKKIWSMQALPKWRGLMPAFPPSRPPTKLQNSPDTLTRKQNKTKFELADAFVIKEWYMYTLIIYFLFIVVFSCHHSVAVEVTSTASVVQLTSAVVWRLCKWR